MLNKFFTGVFTQEDTNKIPKLDAIHTGIPLTHIEITSEKVEKKLLKVKVTKLVWPDGFRLRILKKTASSICLPLSTIYTKSMAEGEVPSTWKEGNITPVHKKRSETTVGNYRPISLTSVVGRMMETIVRDQIVSHMMENSLFCDEQHGFVPGRSYMTQLLITIELWTEMLDTGAPLDVIYLDFKKAFDSVPHKRLLSKLDAYGIGGLIKEWIKSFLVNRKQRVTVNGIMSSWSEVLSGIPQGSVLGPILFVIFINDLPDAVTSTTNIFADYTKLFRAIRGSEDREKLQNYLNQLVK